MNKTGYIAFDFGASSGRMMLGTLIDGKLQLEELHRFENTPVFIGRTYYWDFPRLFHEMKAGLKKVAQLGIDVKGIGIDTWGVDFGWLDEAGRLIGNPVHYRDERGTSVIEESETLLSEAALYEKSGTGKMFFNTVYQLYYDQHKNNTIKTMGKAMLFMPDLFGYFLSGRKYNEYTIASTSSLLDAKTKQFSKDIFQAYGIGMDYLQEIVMPGTVVGTLLPEVQEEVGLGPVPIIASPGHDTACAVAASPLTDASTAFLICGTWSLMGMELAEPVTTEAARLANFTNEGGVEGTVRFLKNINGLFFIQCLKKCFELTIPGIGYPQISQMASESSHDYAIDVKDARFNNPLDMEAAIVSYILEKYDVLLEGVGSIARAAYNGLAQEYKTTVEQMEQVTGKQIDAVCMVGGGIQDKFLCKHVADTLSQRVFQGPVEASVLGNILMQMKATGEIADRFEGRKLV